MSDLDRLRAERESRLRGGDPAGSARYSEVIDRYLAAAGYRNEGGPAVAEPKPAPAAAGIVVVGAEESPASYTAVDHAAIEAEVRGCGLRIVHVQRSGGFRPASRDEGMRLIERLTARVHAYAPAVPVTSRLLTGSASSLLLAEASDAELLVVGQRHSAAAAAMGLGVGDRVATQHPGTVMVVRMPGWPPGPGLGNRPVVVGVELPGTVSPAVRLAFQEAKVRGCELIMVNAIPHAVPSSRIEVVDGLRVHRHLVDEAPAAALIRASNDAAAVVVGRHAYSGSVMPLLGSVTRAVLREAYCPVFVVG